MRNNKPVCKKCGFTEDYCDCDDPDFEAYPGEVNDLEEEEVREFEGDYED